MRPAVSAESLARTSVALLYVEEDRYRLLARNMSDVISRHNRNGAVEFISPAAEAMLGTPAHGSPAMACSTASMSSIVRPTSRRCRMPRAQRATRRIPPRRDAVRGQNISADFIWVEMRCRPLEQGSPETEVVAVMRDVTDRKVQEQALELARTAAEQADASKTRFRRP